MEYNYDPWGNIEYHFVNEELANDEESAMLFTALCPLTYRGYNYDFTTGLYYLQSRYYNPEWGRFINCDDTNILLATQGETHNANLFAYCANNPVNKVDYTGYDYSDIDIKDLVQFLILLFAVNFYDSISISSDAILIEQDDIYISSQKGGINVKLDEEITNSDGSKATLDDYFNMVDDLVNENHKQYVLNSKINIFKKKENKKPVQRINSDIGFYFIALLATYKFYEEFPEKHKDKYPDNPTGKRDFLLSDECVAEEIKTHYLVWKGVKWVDTDWNIIKTKSEDVNIFEQDVLNWNRYAFSYKDGIREKYKNTLANPFYDPDTNEINNKVRESWKTEKIPDNI